MLDAPALQDDFYLNLVDWSAQNVLAVGLGTCVYLWSACTSKVTKLCDFSSSEPQDSVCSVSWSQRGTYLSVGTNNGETQLWDVAKIKMIRTMQVSHHYRNPANVSVTNGVAAAVAIAVAVAVGIINVCCLYVRVCVSGACLPFESPRDHL